MRRITVYTRENGLPSGSDDADLACLLFWASPEMRKAIEERLALRCLTLNELVPDYGELNQQAHALARRCVLEMPLYRGINPLQGWETTLASSLLPALVVSRLYEALTERYDEDLEVVFPSGGDFHRLFKRISECHGARIRVNVLKRDNPLQESRLVRRLSGFARLAREALRDGDPSRAFWVPLEVLDRSYHIRRALWPPANVTSGGIWYYSSYVNFSRALARHAETAVEQPRWVINNHSARSGLPPNAPWHYLWEFRTARPNGHERESVLRRARKAVSEIEGNVGGLPLKELAGKLSVVQELLSHTLPNVLATIDLMIAFFERVRPQSLWIAQQYGGEGTMAQIARRYNVPVIQIQHGLLDQYYGQAPIYSDRFLVWGPFWKELVNPQEQHKVEVTNPGLEMTRAAPPQSDSAPRVTFFTAPLHHVPPLWNPQVAQWETVTLLERLREAGYRVNVRVHPADHTATWQEAWKRHYGRVPPEVHFDKGGSLEHVLARTDVGLVFFSTVFLNCIASGIPVVGLGWYPLVWQDRLERENMTHFVDSLEEAMTAIEILAQEPVVPDLGRVLAPASREVG